MGRRRRKFLRFYTLPSVRAEAGKLGSWGGEPRPSYTKNVFFIFGVARMRFCVRGGVCVCVCTLYTRTRSKRRAATLEIWGQTRLLPLTHISYICGLDYLKSLPLFWEILFLCSSDEVHRPSFPASQLPRVRLEECKIAKIFACGAPTFSFTIN